MAPSLEWLVHNAVEGAVEPKIPGAVASTGGRRTRAPQDLGKK
jgi:hypothetical protein